MCNEWRAAGVFWGCGARSVAPKCKKDAPYVVLNSPAEVASSSALGRGSDACATRVELEVRGTRERALGVLKPHRAAEEADANDVAVRIRVEPGGDTSVGAAEWAEGAATCPALQRLPARR